MGSNTKEDCEHNLISSCSQDQVQCAKGDNTESLVGDLYLTTLHVMLEDGVVSTQNGDGRKSP